VSSGRPGVERRWGLRVETTEGGGIPVLVAQGRIGHASAATLADAIASLGEPVRHLVVDLSAVDYISSAGVRLLDEAAARCAASHGALFLVGAADPILIALDLAGVTRRLMLAPTRESALDRLRAAP
jgi:stage II sporulation protein AA (anti-sigma F factor antagonist)